TSELAGPQWHEGANPPGGDVTVPSDNLGAGIGHVDTSCYLQLRVNFWLPATLSATDPGPWIDNWTIRFTYDQ
ncbi:MAG: hypothetical protein ACC662_08035, partial [Planctomycetota bacterium]